MDGQEISLNEVIGGIEAAQADVNVMKALKEGDQLLKELRSQASLEDFEKIAESVEEQQAIDDAEIAMFGRVLGKDELLEELEALTGDVKVDEPIPDAPTGKIDAVP